MTENDPLELKVKRLREDLRGMDSAVVAFSAGVDSTFLAYVAAQELGERALAVTAVSPSFARRELDEAIELARELGLRHRVIHSNELANPDYAANPTIRCYHCKNELFGLLRKLADEEDYAQVLDGTNADDLHDHRPGKKAAEEAGVRSPLAERGFSKEEIRRASAALGLKTADKPALACLASRFPYGRRITREGLASVERAEDALHAMGFRQLRVRFHQDVARIELPPEDIEKVLQNGLRERIVREIKACGFRHVALDLQGYRRGALNEGLDDGATRKNNP